MITILGHLDSNKWDLLYIYCQPLFAYLPTRWSSFYRLQNETLKLTRPHGQLLISLLLGAGVLRQDQRSVRVRQRRSQACVVLQGLASCGFLAFVLKYRAVRGQHSPGAREPGSPDAKHPVKSNNGAPSLGRHLVGGERGDSNRALKNKTKQSEIPPESSALFHSLPPESAHEVLRISVPTRHVEEENLRSASNFSRSPPKLFLSCTSRPILAAGSSGIPSFSKNPAAPRK